MPERVESRKASQTMPPDAPARGVGRTRPRLRLLATALFLAFVAGIVFWGGFNTVLGMTNTEAFCISCHEMRDNVYREYRETVHFHNRTGVRATCPDCHVPREWTYMVLRKVRASNELFHWLLGSIDTPDKFRAKRVALAGEVWRSMRESDSRECRNCHRFEFMDPEAQKDTAGERHRSGERAGKTCIACHIGIAHRLPEAFLDAEHARFERDKVPCVDCHGDLEGAPADEDWDWDKQEDWDETIRTN